VDSILCIPSCNIPRFAVFFLCGPTPVGRRLSPLPTVLWVPSQAGAGDLNVASPQGMVEPSKFSSPDFKVNIRLTSYSP
jgi:hypothetical protein